MVFDPLPGVVPASHHKNPRSLLFLVLMLVLVLWLTVTVSMGAERTGDQQILAQLLVHGLLGLMSRQWPLRWRKVLGDQR